VTQPTVKETVDALVAAGGTLYASNSLIRPTAHMVRFPRKAGTPCQCNKRPPPLHVYVYEDVDNRRSSVEFLVTEHGQPSFYLCSLLMRITFVGGATVSRALAVPA